MIKKITIKDEKYPQLLKQIKNPPKQLYYERKYRIVKRKYNINNRFKKMYKKRRTICKKIFI